ncbi:hypothetical protein GW17_00012488 [Ensete ventricosum]|nr:hypothetical protein GW17_00012488 [Ensete ventricosum]
MKTPGLKKSRKQKKEKNKKSRAKGRERGRREVSAPEGRQKKNHRCDGRARGHERTSGNGTRESLVEACGHGPDIRADKLSAANANKAMLIAATDASVKVFTTSCRMRSVIGIAADDAEISRSWLSDLLYKNLQFS